MNDQLTIDKIIEKYSDKLTPHYDGYTDQLYFVCEVDDYRINIDVDRDWFVFKKVTLSVSLRGSVTMIATTSGKEARRITNILMGIKKAYENRLAERTLSEIL